ncbi:iron(III) transport system substrate-binding protein [Pararhizobium capsulatum DSM 1112]|uniref:Iron(III) transport system substrate-binding protein n=1 Tax=Pararhizobium capsulatum DSM 1112 TaxID=1121113 RepID=A0ABU0BYL4_9HYPH|nr:extracellular solute-binding protein [Pararhizobium capsulatum]MDQ0323048.1 iron(III) transport system substrate-binding protein [Pararhizobium capsulatum DSM 1112]
MRPVTFSAMFAGILMCASHVQAQDVKLEAPIFETLYQEAKAAKDTEVVYYFPARTEEAERLNALWAENFPDITLTIVAKKAPDIITQVEAEKAAGVVRADVVTTTQPFVAAKWKAEGRFAPYKVSSFTQLGGYADKDGAYYSTGVYLLPAAYNSTAITDRSELPASLADFLDPKWKGKIVLADPATAGNTLTFFLALLQNGEITWDYLAKLATQDVLFVRGNSEVVRALASGERVVAPTISSFNIFVSKEKGQSVDFYGLNDGTLLAEQPSGILAGAPHPIAAKLLLEVLTSAEGQAIQADAGKYWPTNATAKTIEGLPELASFNPFSVELHDLSDDKSADEFIQRFASTFGRD